MKVPFSPPDVGEEEIKAVTEVLRSGWITTGAKTKQFEKEIAGYCGTHQAIGLSSSTAGMEMVLRLLGVGPGDEVITSAYTYTASASVIAHVGADIVLVDTKKDSFFLDPVQVKKAITNKTKAVIAVDIGGVMCDYDHLRSLLEEKKALFSPKNELQAALGRPALMADASHSFGSSLRSAMSGAAADFSSFSFHAVKNLTTAEGGAVTWRADLGWDDEALYRALSLLSMHGQTKDALSKTQGNSWEYDIVSLGYKANMTDLTAAIGLAQLKRYPGLLKKRKDIIRYYDERLADQPVSVLSHFPPGGVSNGHLYMVSLHDKTSRDRNRILSALSDQGVAANVHYKPLPLLSAYKERGFAAKDYPHALSQFETEITLPLHSRLSLEQRAYVMDCFIPLL